MSKFSFDPKTLGWPCEEITDMRCPEPAGALQAFVSTRPGIEAIKEVASFANIQWSETASDFPADDVNATLLRQNNRNLPK